MLSNVNSPLGQQEHWNISQCGTDVSTCSFGAGGTGSLQACQFNEAQFGNADIRTEALEKRGENDANCQLQIIKKQDVMNCHNF